MKELILITFGMLLFAGCKNSTKKEHKNGLANVPTQSINLPYSFKTVEAEDLSIKAFNLKKEGKFEEAIKVYKDAIEIEEDNPKLYFDIAECYANDGKLQDGVRSLDKAIEIDPLFAAFYHNRGLYFYHLKEYEKAINDLENAVHLDSIKAGAYYNLSMAYYAVTKLEDACKAFKKAQKLGLREEIADQYEYVDLQMHCNL